MKLNIDTRTIADLVSEAGYEHARYECETEDGYIVALDRVKNINAFNVILFMHGVMDSS